MTTPKKPLQQTTNKHQEKTRQQWYRAPVVWLGALVLLLTCFGYYHLISMSHRLAADNPMPEVEYTEGTITHIFGVSLTDTDQARDDNDRSER